MQCVWAGLNAIHRNPDTAWSASRLPLLRVLSVSDILLIVQLRRGVAVGEVRMHQLRRLFLLRLSAAISVIVIPVVSIFIRRERGLLRPLDPPRRELIKVDL